MEIYCNFTGWAQVNVELHNLQPQDIIMTTWVGHVARMGKMGKPNCPKAGNSLLWHAEDSGESTALGKWKGSRNSLKYSLIYSILCNKLTDKHGQIKLCYICLYFTNELFYVLSLQDCTYFVAMNLICLFLTRTIKFAFVLIKTR
jgi:hypothetical protein